MNSVPVPDRARSFPIVSERCRDLTAHFFRALFDLGFLSETASNSIARTITGIGGVLIAIGFVMVRVFLKRYGAASSAGDPWLLKQTVLTDHVFLMAVPMWTVAFVSVLAGSSLLPDESDFRILTVLPISRRLIFGSKLLALILFVGVFMAMTQTATLPVFGVTAIGHWAGHSLPMSTVAFLLAGAAGCLFAALTVTAMYAVLMALVPARIFPTVSAATTSALLFALVIAVPLVGHVPSFGEAFKSGSTWLHVFPPAWFVGLERLLLGESEFAGLALSASAGVGIAGVVASAGYLFIYRHFDRVMTRPAHDSGTRVASSGVSIRESRKPAFAAIGAFTLQTLSRSALHQGILVALAALGTAIVTNGVLDLDLQHALASTGWRRRELLLTVTWVPFVLVFVTTLAVRASLLVPIEVRANWVFRITERPKARADQLEAAAWTLWLIGVLLPVIVSSPLLWAALGTQMIPPALIAVASGTLLVEVLMRTWRRIPFTCSYLPGKSFIPFVLLKLVFAFGLFTMLGGGLAEISTRASARFTIILALLLFVPAVILRFLRRRQALRDPLEFEDVLPTESCELRLID